MITLPPRASVDLPHCLLTFGSDLQQCDVVLHGEGIRPVHCKVWAQLNSGTRILVVDDKSGAGTRYWNADDINTNRVSKVANRARAVSNLRGIRIASYHFILRYPEKHEEVLELERWSHRHEPIPVTNAMLEYQLGAVQRQLEMVEVVGKGGNGTVRRCMEKRCGLMVAVKQVGFTNTEHQNAVSKEIMFMRSLKHVSHLSTFEISDLTTHSIILLIFSFMSHIPRVC